MYWTGVGKAWVRLPEVGRWRWFEGKLLVAKTRSTVTVACEMVVMDVI